MQINSNELNFNNRVQNIFYSNEYINLYFNLLNKLKIDAIATEPMSLADIYNYNQEEYGKEERRIGL